MTSHPERPGGFDPEEHLRDLTSYEPFKWVTTSDMLDAGSVVHVQPRGRYDWVYIFECTGSGGGKTTTGYLTKFVFNIGGKMVQEGPISAVINTIHPSPYLAQQNAPYLEFLLEEEDRQTRIIPPGSDVKRAFSADLARQVFEQAATEQNIEPFGL